MQRGVSLAMCRPPLLGELYHSSTEYANQESTERAVADDCMITNFTNPKLSTWTTIITTKEIYTQKKTATVIKTLLFNYVYCSPWNITLKKGTFRCPPAVIELSNDLKFSTIDIDYIPKMVKIIFSHLDLPFVDKIQQGYFVNDSVVTNDVQMFDKIQELQQTINKFDEKQEFKLFSNHGVDWSFILSITIYKIILLILAYIILWIYKLTDAKLTNSKLNSMSRQNQRPSKSNSFVFNDAEQLKMKQLTKQTPAINVASIKQTTSATSSRLN